MSIITYRQSQLVSDRKEKRTIELHTAKKGCLTMVYGFKKGSRYFDVVMTLHKEGNRTKLYGFLSKVNMNSADLFFLWDYLRDNVDTKFLEMEVLPEHARIYESYLPVIAKRRSVTFDKLKSETLLVKVK